MQESGKEQDGIIPIKNLHLDRETYRAITKLSYSQNVPVEKLINDMLKKHLAVQGFLRNGFQLFHRDIVKILANAIPEEKLVQEARNFPVLPKEMVILNVDGVKPDLKKYMKSFVHS